MAPPSRTSPWFAVDAAWWPGVAAAIPKPWPQEAIMLDLRWWADQEALHPGSRPGRPELVERWGVSDWTARQALKSAHIWASPLQRASSGPPEPLQRPSRTHPAPTRSKHDNGWISSSATPAPLQNPSSGPPEVLHTRVVVQTADAESELTIPPNPPAAAGGLDLGLAHVVEDLVNEALLDAVIPAAPATAPSGPVLMRCLGRGCFCLSPSDPVAIVGDHQLLLSRPVDACPGCGGPVEIGEDGPTEARPMDVEPALDLQARFQRRDPSALAPVHFGVRARWAGRVRVDQVATLAAAAANRWSPPVEERHASVC